MTNNNNSYNNILGTNDNDVITDLMVKFLKSLKGGKVSMKIGQQSAMDMVVNEPINRINMDLMDPELLRLFVSLMEYQEKVDDLDENNNDSHKKGTMDKIKDKLHDVKEFAQNLTDSEGELFDKLDAAKEFAQRLTDNGLTIVLLRQGKEVVVLGKEAKPTVSKIISGSDDLQIKSVREVSKLAGDLKPEDEDQD